MFSWEWGLNVVSHWTYVWDYLNSYMWSHVYEQINTWILFRYYSYQAWTIWEVLSIHWIASCGIFNIQYSSHMAFNLGLLIYWWEWFKKFRIWYERIPQVSSLLNHIDSKLLLLLTSFDISISSTVLWSYSCVLSHHQYSNVMFSMSEYEV